MSGAQGQLSRHVRARTDARPRRRLLIAGAALLLILLIVSTLSTTGFGPSDLANAAIQKAKSFLELIQQRSPGHRTRGLLVKTKHRIAKPHERALPKVRIAIPILPPGPPSLFQLVAPPITPQFASVEAIPIPPLVEQGPLPPVSWAPPPGPIVPLTETPPPPPIVPPPVTPVPEPSTWASMLLGFALVGWQLRRRRDDLALAR